MHYLIINRSSVKLLVKFLIFIDNHISVKIFKLYVEQCGSKRKDIQQHTNIRKNKHTNELINCRRLIIQKSNNFAVIKHAQNIIVLETFGVEISKIGILKSTFISTDNIQIHNVPDLNSARCEVK